MGANSAIRRAAKSILFPLVNDTTYAYLQAVSKALDIRRGTWTEPELDLIPLGLRHGETALDIGANFGIYSYAMSRAVGKAGKVYAFEPIPSTYKALKIVGRLLGFTKNVEFVLKGCSNENGKISFSVPVQGSGAFSAGQAYIGRRNDEHEGKEGQVRWETTTEIEAEVVRLDDFLPPTGELSLVKLDIEGAELFCLRGAEELVAKYLPTIICEINPWFLDGFGIKLDELTGFFFDLGYRLYFFDNTGAFPALRSVAPSDVVEDNYVFIHPSRQDRFAHLISPPSRSDSAA